MRVKQRIAAESKGSLNLYCFKRSIRSRSRHATWLNMPIGYSLSWMKPLISSKTQGMLLLLKFKLLLSPTNITVMINSVINNYQSEKPLILLRSPLHIGINKDGLCDATSSNWTKVKPVMLPYYMLVM